MNTLELTLQRKTDSGYPVIAALTLPSGFLPLRREGAFNLDLAALAELQYDPLAYGTALGQALFVDEIRDTFREGLAGSEPLRVLLSVETPDLRTLDWHRLAAPFDGRWRFLASQQNTPFSLAVPSPASAHFPAIGCRDLRALLLVAGPEALSGDYKLAPFDVPATTASIQTALGDIPCDILPNPSLDALCAALTDTPYTILHLVCHGSVNERGEAILYFPKDERRTPTPATDLLNRLSSLARLPHFAFIAACESALPQNGLGSLAGRLVRELGLPAVLAMTDRVSIATASAIAAPFYAHLYQHGQPDLALAQSLAGLQGAHDLTVPAIFSRLGDRPLFDDNSERALTEKELEFGLDKLAGALPERAPVMESLRDALTRRLRSTPGADSKLLSESSRTERKETLDQLNSLSLEALDLSFNALCLGQTPPAYDSRSPFRGLESFRPEDAPYFFGRETLTRKLVQKLNEHNFLAVLGASGSGKSSLVMAGLIPALNVPYTIFRPGAEPLSELDKALQAGPQLLVVDQFEELFTLSAREQRADFISRLLEESQRLRVVITLRADFLGEVAPFKLLKDEVQNHQEIIPPMDEAELRRAMEGQAGCTGLRFESDLSQQMLDDVSGEPGAMPLLQHALWTLWTRRHGRWLRAEEYRAFGGVKQAIASTAEAVYARCTELERDRLRDIFLRLTRLDEGTDGRDTRRRVLLRDLIPADSDPAATTLLIKQLADARLVVVTGDEVEVAHEALIRHWERLRAWLNDDRDNLRLREGVSDDARRWENAGRDESLLNHRGPRLELALAMSKNPRYRLNPVEQAYLDGCVGLRKSEKAAAARRRRYTFAGVSAALIVIIAILVGWGWTSNIQVAEANAAKATAVGEANIRATAQANAERQASIAISGKLAAYTTSEITLKNDLSGSRALLLAREAVLTTWGKYGFVSIEADAALRQAVNNAPPWVSTLQHDLSINAVAWSPDGTQIITASGEKAHVWDVKGKRQLSELNGHATTISAVSWSPDGTRIVTGDIDGTLFEWNLIDKKVFPLLGHTWVIGSIDWSKDGKYIVTASSDGTVRIWDAENGQEINELMANSGRVRSAVWNPKEMQIASGGDDGLIRVWNAVAGRELIRLTGHTERVLSVSWSPDGRFLATAGSDMTIRIWDVTTWKEIHRMIGHSDIVWNVKWSPDSTLIVSASDDGTVRIWNPWNQKTREEMLQLTGHLGIVRPVAWSPDGASVITGGEDGTVRFWKIKDEILKRRLTMVNTINIADWSPNGQQIATSGSDGIVRLWDTTKGKVSCELSGHKGRVNTTTFNPNGTFIASGGDDGTARIWRVATCEELQQLKGHNKSVRSISWSPDGSHVVTASDDETARIWDPLTGQELYQLKGLTGSILSIAWNPRGKYIVSSGTNNSIRIWDADNGVELRQLNGHTGSIYSVGWSPDGKFIASASADGTARIWDATSGQELLRLNNGYTGTVRSVSWSPDGSLVATTSDDGAVRIWVVDSGLEIRRLNGHTGWVYTAAWSPSGTLIISAGVDGTARIWDTSIENLLRKAENLIQRNPPILTREERCVFLDQCE